MKQKSFIQLLKYGNKHLILTILGIVLSAVSAVLAVIPYIFLWNICKELIDVYPNFQNAVNIESNALWAVGTSIASILLYFLGLICTHLAAFRVASNMRKVAIKHVMKLPMGFFNEQQTGTLRKVIDENAAETETLLAHNLPDLAGTIVTPIAIIVIIFVINPILGAVSLIPIIWSIITLFQMMGGNNSGFMKKYMEALEKMSSEAVEYVRGIPVVKTFNQTVYSFKSFKKVINDYGKFASDYALSCRKPYTWYTIALNLYFALLVISATIMFLVTGNPLSILLDVIFYILFTPLVVTMMNKIMYATESVGKTDIIINRLNQILNIKPMEIANNNNKIINGEIKFENVYFSYTNDEKYAIQDVSFEVKKGETIGFVGPSGGGKTTTASLIARFFDRNKGKITIDGIDIKDIPFTELMNKVAFIFQDNRLFHDTLYNNVKMAKPNATDEEIRKALSYAQCDDIIEKLPDGLNTVIGAGGVYLSGGEMQRIAIARTILKDAQIIIFDEATAFTDPENEVKIQKAFKHLTKNKTVIMIAHRLSTIKDADKIIVFNKGKIIERGNHNELLEKNEFYAKMWKNYQKSISWKIGGEVKC